MIPSSSFNAIAAAALAFASAFASASAGAQTTSVVVNGSADLYNASGAFDGTAPAFVDVTGFTSVSFSASTGATVTVNGGTLNTADGIGSVSGEFNTGTSTLSGITSPTAGFIAGVFLSGTVVAGAPAALNFTTGGTSFASLAPLLQQTFFVGDGLTGHASGATQAFYVPVGATRLYLGLTDACGYSGSPSCFGDNSGSFTVAVTGIGGTVTPVPAVPEPQTYALMFAGLVAIGAATRRRSARQSDR